MPIYEPLVNAKTSELLDQQRITKIENFRLFFTLYTQWEKPKVGERGKPGFRKITDDTYEQHRKLMYLNPLLVALHQQQTTHLQQLTTESVTKQLTPFKGVVTGYGEPSVYETGMRLDAVFGFPYIPASSWQGVIRSWFIEQYTRGDEDKALADAGFCYLFGSEKQAGNILFLDAYPKTLVPDSLQPDIFTPHFGDYYTTGSTPTDRLSPIPVSYLVVKNTSFVFRFGHQHSQREPVTEFAKGGLFAGHNPLKLIIDELPNIFFYYGVGARTKNGFGRGEISAYTPPPKSATK